MKKSRMLAAMLCVVLLVGVLTVPAYAGGGDESEGSEYVPWVGLEPAETLPVEEEPAPDTKPFTPDGTGTVVDNATDQDGKEFFTITTADEAVFYLVIDRQRGAENVYFLNAVTISDLMALAEPEQQTEVTEPVTVVEPEPAPDSEPEPEPEKSGMAAMLLALMVKWCANYDRAEGCLPLDCECYMLGKSRTGPLCRYFREAVLPMSSSLETALTAPAPVDTRSCLVCGRPALLDGRRRYCSPACAQAAHRKQQRDHMRKKRG